MIYGVASFEDIECVLFATKKTFMWCHLWCRSRNQAL